MKKKLHIICFTVPYPVNYGGVFDLFHMLPALHSVGVAITLHCFDYGRGQQPALEAYCDQVIYYERNEGHKGITARLPYIVSSRKNEALLQNLLSDDAPILMHGIHSTYLLNDDRFAHRTCLVRLHNTEHLYYRQLARTSSSWMKSLYYFLESRQLKKYEKKIARRANFLAVSPLDVQHYREEFNCKNISYLPVFLPNWEMKNKGGMGSYCLFHGDLQVPVNEKTATRLLTGIFNQLKIPLVITGRNPSPRLMELAHREQHTCLVANPSDSELEDMIARAHIHVLPAQHGTGIQLKLLHALYQGRHCVSNMAAVKGHPIAALVHTAESDEALANLVHQLYQQPFGEEDFNDRKRILSAAFDASAQTNKLIQLLFGNSSHE